MPASHAIRLFLNSVAGAAPGVTAVNRQQLPKAHGRKAAARLVVGDVGAVAGEEPALIVGIHDPARCLVCTSLIEAIPPRVGVGQPAPAGSGGARSDRPGGEVHLGWSGSPPAEGKPAQQARGNAIKAQNHREGNF
jgi:hypothetical protein